MENLITENIEVGAPANPVIVQNVASLPGGTRLYVAPCSEDYPGGVIEVGGEYVPKVLKAGHPVICTDTPYAQSMAWYSGYFESGLEEQIFIPLGVITEDAPVYKNDEGYYEAHASVMVMGVVDAVQMPGKFETSPVSESGVSVFHPSSFNCGIVFINTMAASLKD